MKIKNIVYISFLLIVISISIYGLAIAGGTGNVNPKNETLTSELTRDERVTLTAMGITQAKWNSKITYANNGKSIEGSFCYGTAIRQKCENKIIINNFDQERVYYINGTRQGNETEQIRMEYTEEQLINLKMKKISADLLREEIMINQRAGNTQIDVGTKIIDLTIPKP